MLEYMRSALCTLAPVLCAGLLSLGPALPVAAEDGGFREFCATWMKKLEKREQDNLRRAKPSSDSSGFALEYIGYSKKPLRCEAKPIADAHNKFVGRLVYHEIRYRHRGSERRELVRAIPTIVTRTQVMEIFSFDGSNWIY